MRIWGLTEGQHRALERLFSSSRSFRWKHYFSLSPKEKATAMVVSILIFDKSFRNIHVSEVSKNRTWIYFEMLCIISVSKYITERERCEHLLRFFHRVYYICIVRILFKLSCVSVTIGDALQGWTNTDSATERS